MSDTGKPVEETLSDEDLKSDKQLSLRSMVATAAAGAAIAAGAGSVLGAFAPQASAAQVPDAAAAATADGIARVAEVDLKDEDLTSGPMSSYLMKGDTCPIGGDEWKGVNADGPCKSIDDFTDNDPDTVDK